ncbi:MAG: branched-chain amino acid aminotransferase [Bacteroidetes bacterium]|nr:MAG: branched-chain amino acid aminotransferase [Bacteroidota bacterium]
MELTTEIKIRKASHSRLHEIDFKHLQFGKHFSDHMLICDFHDEQWHEPIIVPFANLSLSPATLAFHYGQTVFEGMKAFRMFDGRVNIFRMDKHYDRFARSLERMSMAVVPKEIFMEGLKTLVDLDKEWIPQEADCALYLRPFVIATENAFGVKVSSDYRFIIFTAPVPSVYSRPIKVKVETEYIRAAKGGTGFAKCGGNYGGAFYPTQLARQQGYDQLLWTDAAHHRFIEESGMMNVMFVIGDTIVTPPSSDTVLDGVTKDSLLTLATDLEFKVDERPLSLDELENAFRENSIIEAFGVGTAAVVAPIRTININNTDFHLPEHSHENLSHKLKQRLERIRTGQEEDLYNWCHVV